MTARVLGAVFVATVIAGVSGRAAAGEGRGYEGPTSVAAGPGATPQIAMGPPLKAAPPVTQPRPSPDPTPVPLRGTPAVDEEPLRVRPLLDITITLGAFAPTAVLAFWVEPQLPNATITPGGPTDDIGRADRVAIGKFSQTAESASDALVIVGVVAPLIYHAIEAGVRRKGYSRVRGRGFFRRYGTDVLIYGQAMAINSLLTEILKAAIRRPRPLTFIDPNDVSPDKRDELMDAQASNGADRSFPSGHTSAAFAAATAGATLLTFDLLGRSRAAIAVTWIAGGALATTTGALRVLAGKHFPSDVLTGGLLGIAVGAAVPLAHWRPTRLRISGRKLFEQVTWSPQTGQGYGGLVIRGRFR